MLCEPQIPYLQIPELPLVPSGAIADGVPEMPITIKPFGALVAVGVYVGAALVLRQGRRLGFEPQAVMSLLLHVLVAGFIGGHVFALLWYFPGRVLEEPWSLVAIWEGQSSFGGFTGAVLGGLWWRSRWRTQLLPYADLVCSALPVGWAFGRAGCSLAHDHPGIRSQAFIAVRFPGGGRLDLGLLEFSFTVVLAAVFLWLRRRPRPWGFYAGLICIAYAPFRFGLDFLRARTLPAFLGAPDVRYGSLTPAQWACFVVLPLGVGLFWWALRRAGDSGATRPPPLPEPERLD